MRRERSALAKITPPSLLGIVGRPRLFRMLDRGRRGPLTWVTGPPGAGKTSLVADYLRRRRLRYLWYHVDPGDADVASFFYHVSLAAARAGPGSRRRSRSCGRDTGPGSRRSPGVTSGSCSHASGRPSPWCSTTTTRSRPTPRSTRSSARASAPCRPAAGSS